MAEIQVDRTEIRLLMMGLNSLDESRLTEEGTAARARLAYKLGGAVADEMFAQAMATGAGEGDG